MGPKDQGIHLQEMEDTKQRLEIELVDTTKSLAPGRGDTNTYKGC